MLEPHEREAHVAAKGPWLYHGTAAENLTGILVSGLRPGSELGHSNAPNQFHRTRAGHVYLCSLDHRRTLGGELGLGTVRVDLRKLDPGLIDPDEDMVQQAWLFDGEQWVSVCPPIYEEGWQAGPSGERTLAHWADTTPGFDASEVTTRSLARGRISYRDTVPAHAVEMCDPSG